MDRVRPPERELLLDVTRLVWRTWRGRHPTGIDRVCRAYVEHFRRRALGVIQRDGFKLVLSAAQSDKIFRLFLSEGRVARLKMATAVAGAALTARRFPPKPGMLYLNVGHTGLNDPSLSKWIAQNRLRAIYLIHDLIPVTSPEYCRGGEAEKHERRMALALKSAAGIIGNSQTTLDDLSAFAAKRDLPMPSTHAALISGYEKVEEVKRIALDRPHFIVVGTIEGRKNHLLLLKIWQRLFRRMGNSTPLLIVVGQRGWEADEAIAILDRPGVLRGTVREVVDCGDELLAGLIAGARALLMPSFAEGFGLPISEALSLGTPVIASDLPVFREIAGDIPLYLHPDDAPVWEASIESFQGEGPERLRQLAEIRDYQPPTWAEHFNSLESWMKTIVVKVADHSEAADFQLETTA